MAISLFGFVSGPALATVNGVLNEVPVMLLSRARHPEKTTHEVGSMRHPS
jgi:ACR3 family arsenite efflux pump ArsB